MLSLDTCKWAGRVPAGKPGKTFLLPIINVLANLEVDHLIYKDVETSCSLSIYRFISSLSNVKLNPMLHEWLFNPWPIILDHSLLAMLTKRDPSNDEPLPLSLPWKFRSNFAKPSKLPPWKRDDNCALYSHLLPRSLDKRIHWLERELCVLHLPVKSKHLTNVPNRKVKYSHPAPIIYELHTRVANTAYDSPEYEEAGCSEGPKFWVWLNDMGIRLFGSDSRCSGKGQRPLLQALRIPDSRTPVRLTRYFGTFRGTSVVVRSHTCAKRRSRRVHHQHFQCHS